MDATGMRRRAVLDAYESGCSEHRVQADKWLRGALWAWAVNGQETEPPMHRLPAAVSWTEHEARRRIVETTCATVTRMGEHLPDEIVVQMLVWLHDVKDWNA